jgi:hypothetical protein
MAQGDLGATSTTALTLSDWAKRLDPDGKVDKIVELLNQTNEILKDAMWVEGNLPTGHKTTVRSDIPTPTWRRLNYGVQPTKSKTAQITEACGMLEAYAEVDKALADLNGNTNAFRLSEDRPFLEGMNQELATKIFYGDTDTDPEQILGFHARYDALTLTGKPTANNYLDQVINHGGSGSDVTSMWLVVWGANTVHMIFPKGSKAGLQHNDKGQVTLYDSDGGRYEGYRTHYKWDVGMVVRDWRYVVRIANIESALTTTFLYKKMIQAVNTIPSLGMGKPVFYCNRNVKTIMDNAAYDKTNVLVTTKEIFGAPVTHFWGIPVRLCDAILNTETALS